jgi:Protein of unknown function (DUF3043)
VFKRRRSEDSPASESVETAGGASGKGRPTPTRKEAEAARQARVKAPRDSKQAKAAARADASAARSARRAAAMSGDERYLPARDQGPVRGFTRDYVDRRRRVGELVLPGALLVIVLGFIPTMTAVTYLGFYALILAVIVDAVVLRFQLKAELGRRFPDESTRGALFYAVMRSLQLRRLRIPRPRVTIGQPL